VQIILLQLCLSTVAKGHHLLAVITFFVTRPQSRPRSQVLIAGSYIRCSYLFTFRNSSLCGIFATYLHACLSPTFSEIPEHPRVSLCRLGCFLFARTEMQGRITVSVHSTPLTRLRNCSRPDKALKRAFRTKMEPSDSNLNSRQRRIRLILRRRLRV
jgi:hypothetical protein